MNTEYFSVNTANRYLFGKPDRARLRDIQALNTSGVIDEWPLLEVVRSDTVVPDWLDGLVTSRLLSPHVREMVEDHLGARDNVQWLPACLVSEDGTRHDYWLVHFPDHPDVLHDEFTTRGLGPVPIRWVIDSRKAAGLHFFHVPFVGRATLVSPDLAQALRDAMVSGVEIKPALVAGG